MSLADTPIFIVGPCAAESREQVLLTAQEVVVQCPDRAVIFRAGVWKPRTNPHTFQGIGTEALTWLQEVKNTYHLPVATEVATPQHAEQALNAGIDYLWLGARTTANPIAVQELADTIAKHPNKASLQGVLVKNPVNEDTSLWLGDIERIEKTGVRTMAIHRGCGHRPCWAMAHTLRNTRPDIPLLLDPSHLGGAVEKIPALVDYARLLAFDGLMIETHIRPAEALSDTRQQVTPEQLKALLNRFLVTDNQPNQTELRWLRAEIDEIDDQLWSAIARRMEVSERIGQGKKENSMPALQPARFQQIMQQRIEWAESVGLPKEMVENIFNEIHRASLSRQN